MKTLREEIQAEERRELDEPYQERRTDTLLRATDIIKVLPPAQPFTFLDLGANLGVMSLKIAETLPASAGVMIEGGPSSDALKKIVLIQRPDRLVLVSRMITAEELMKLEIRFDYVLAINFIHWFEDWYKMLEAVYSLGKNLILSVPPLEDRLAVGQQHNKAILECLECCVKRSIGRYHRSHAQGIEEIFMLTPHQSIKPIFKLCQAHKILNFYYPSLKKIKALEKDHGDVNRV